MYDAAHTRLSLLEHMRPQRSYLPLRIINHVRSVAEDHSGAFVQIVGPAGWRMAGRDVASGFYLTYLLASLLLVLGGVAFLAFASPDDHPFVEKVSRGAAQVHS